MRKGKTTMLTDMSLSTEVIFRNKARELLLSNDLKFLNFPWINLENDIKGAMDSQEVYNLATCRKYVERREGWFKGVKNDTTIAKSWHRHCKKHKIEYNLIYDYDYERYGLTYNDNLKVVDIWEVIKNYVQLYFIYTIESSLIISNFSIRSDNIICDSGNFPLWSTDFFKRKSSEIDKKSCHSNILDFDMLRIGRKIIENNKFANLFEFGIIDITEIGKEKGNAPENLEKKKNAEETNQKNDLFDVQLKMIGHSATVDNYTFVKVISDEQRAMSLGINSREIGDVVTIKEKGELKLLMPFFNVMEIVHSFIYGLFEKWYGDYRFNRGDNSLICYLYKKLASKIHSHYVKKYNTFGCIDIDVLVDSGTMTGVDALLTSYYFLPKKIYSIKR